MRWLRGIREAEKELEKQRSNRAEELVTSQNIMLRAASS